MGGSSSKQVKKEEPPRGPDAPEWIEEVYLKPAQPEQSSLLKKVPEFRFELPDRVIQNEFARKAASECSRRCFFY